MGILKDLVGLVAARAVEWAEFRGLDGGRVSRPGVSQSLIRVHFFYVVLILVLFIIILVSVKFTKLEGFTDYLSVAGGFTSLVLGVLAIIYSFVSTGAFSRSLVVIEGEANKIASVAQDLNEVLRTSQSVQDTAEIRTEELKGLVVGMRAGLDELSQSTQEIAGSVAKIPVMIDEMKGFTPVSAEGERSLDSLMKWDRDAVEKYLLSTSVVGITTIYALYKAHLAGGHVSLYRIFGNSVAYYAWGFLMSAKAAGIIVLDESERVKQLPSVRLHEPSAELVAAINSVWKSRLGVSEVTRKKYVRYADKIDSSMIFNDQESSEAGGDDD